MILSIRNSQCSVDMQQNQVKHKSITISLEIFCYYLANYSPSAAKITNVFWLQYLHHHRLINLPINLPAWRTLILKIQLKLNIKHYFRFNLLPYIHWYEIRLQTVTETAAPYTHRQHSHSAVGATGARPGRTFLNSTKYW